MGFDQDAGGEPEQGCGVGEDPDDVGPSLDLPVEPFQGVGAPDLLLVRAGEVAERGQVALGVLEQLGDGGELFGEHVGDFVDLGSDLGLPGLGEDRADVAATISAWPLLTRARALRMKWTRQRCQLAPCIVVEIALMRPLWASLMTS